MVDDHNMSVFGTVRPGAFAYQKNNLLSPNQQHQQRMGCPYWAAADNISADSLWTNVPQPAHDVASAIQMDEDMVSEPYDNVDMPDLYGSDFDDGDDDDYDEFGVGDVLLDDSAGVWRVGRPDLAAGDDGQDTGSDEEMEMSWQHSPPMNTVFTAPSAAMTTSQEVSDETDHTRMNLQYKRQLLMWSQHHDADSMRGGMIPPPECPYSQTMGMSPSLTSKRKRRLSSYQYEPGMQRKRLNASER
ncbi:hypothetical protein BZA70DRAFT_30312 [Myxozyma melibiosi]|uniref:Uncharacterized protein n=1 Tax=Myxozyma melibiosi TaxID=54550 RepID=A0ABR1FDM7_9ASCO